MHYPTYGKESTPPSGAYLYDSVSFGVTQRPNSPKTPDVLYDCPDIVGEQLDAMPCTTDHKLWRYISAAPRSLHPGGVHVAYVDGHASFMSNDVDELTMAYQAAINDEEFHNAP
jgi:prepilin-type processing-associated H-X9-DG protein